MMKNRTRMVLAGQGKLASRVQQGAMTCQGRQLEAAVVQGRLGLMVLPGREMGMTVFQRGHWTTADRGQVQLILERK